MGLLGKALTDLHLGKQKRPLWVHCDRAEDEVMNTNLFFSRFTDFHRVERVAINRCGRRVLDLGAGAGRHSLELQKRGIDSLAVDSDPLLCALMQKRGVKGVLCSTWQEMQPAEPVDTILAMMNGIGLCGRRADFAGYILKLKSLLAPGGKLLMDSSSVDYLPPPPQGNEPEEVVFHFSYEDEVEAPFYWFFAEMQYLIDTFPTLGFDARCIYRHDDGRFLIEATLSE